jgi:hypothetical protein
VDYKVDLATSRAGLDNRVLFRGLALVSPRKPKPDDRKAALVGPLFSAAEMRHNFAIWGLEKSATSRRGMHLYYCVRCKWTFQVDDYSASVTPLDENGNPIQNPEAAERLATFGIGPCPAFSGLIGHGRLTQVVTRRESCEGGSPLCFTLWAEFGRNQTEPGDDLPRSAKVPNCNGASFNECGRADRELRVHKACRRPAN